MKTTTKVPRKNKLQMLIGEVAALRLAANVGISQPTRVEFGQFMTPEDTAGFMASLFEAPGEQVRLLDPGAGVGSLTAAFVAHICSRPNPPKAIAAVAYEIDHHLCYFLNRTFELLRETCRSVGVRFEGEIRRKDFISECAQQLNLFGQSIGKFDCVVMNPPYRKINSDSNIRMMLRLAGIETSNLYTAFMAIGTRLLVEDGELVSINPRSFCNGPYFRPFRQDFLQTMRIDRLHVFECRKTTFKDDDVLQENVIVHAVRTRQKRDIVTISTTTEDGVVSSRVVPQSQLVRPNDPESFIHIAPDEDDDMIRERMSQFSHSLPELGLSVSTGRVVDFRARESLRPEPEAGTAPLIYPAHFKDGFISWPLIGHKKANAIIDSTQTESLLVPEGIYVLVKRFSAKEERRRITAAVFDPDQIRGPRVGFENHLNYFHSGGKGLTRNLGIGLCVFLNSTLVDRYFRHFNGHTQVNATDLRNLRYPSKDQLLALSKAVRGTIPPQKQLDRVVSRLLG